MLRVEFQRMDCGEWSEIGDCTAAITLPSWRSEYFLRSTFQNRTFDSNQSCSLVILFLRNSQKEVFTMKLFLAMLIVFRSLCAAEGAPVIRGIAPNEAAPGETLTV